MITISLNNTVYEVEENVSLLDALNQFKITQNGVAVAVNQTIISKSDWSKTSLNESDKILVIKATQGG